jgi:hypothetical protein
MGLGTGVGIKPLQKWYAVRGCGQTGVFATMEQAIGQIAGFPGAQMKEFERADPGGIDRGLLQAKMWLRSGGAEDITTSAMGPPGLRSMPPKTVASSKHAEEFLPSTRRFSPMLLDAFHYGFFGEVCAREAEAEERREISTSTCASVSPTEKPIESKAAKVSHQQWRMAPQKTIIKGREVLACVKTREKFVESKKGGLYARTYQDNGAHRHRSVLLS